MPEDQPKIGGISRYKQLGGKKADQPDSQRTGPPESSSIPDQERQRAGLPDSQISGIPAPSQSELSAIPHLPSPDIQIISYARPKRPERKSQLIYMPPDLKRRLKRYAQLTEQEISDVATKAIQTYLDNLGY